MRTRTLETEISEAEFAELVAGLAADEAPRRFALLTEVGEREDGWIVGWGLAFADHVQVVGFNGRASHLVLRSAERALELLSRNTKMRLIWIDQPHPETQ